MLFPTNTIYINFGGLQQAWESQKTRKLTGSLLISGFLLALFLIELKRLGLLPGPLSHIVPNSHFYAVNFAFTLLLGVEVIGLIFALVHSVANSVGKQLEILSLILLRDSFKEFIYFNEPIIWSDIQESVLHILSDTGGAIVVFLLLGMYYKMQTHQKITSEEQEQKRFVGYKKMVSILLLVTFTVIGLYDFTLFLTNQNPFDFFNTFYTILIFSDILIVLISLQYSSSYHIVFRNSGFALITVLIRLALTSPAYFNVGLALTACLFALGLTYSYNKYAPFISESNNRINK